MLKLKKNVLIVGLVMLVVLVVITPVNVYATTEIITPGGSTNATPTPPTPSTAPTPTPKVTPTPTTQTNLPKTGIEDYTGLIVVTIVLGASAVFAYKKIKEYNKF